jgi:hypothetical protein
VIDGHTGYVVDEADRERFVERILRLLDDRGFGRRLGLRGRELAQRCAPPAMAETFVRVYREAIAAEAAANDAVSPSPPEARDASTPRSTSA